jgi:hypothetical protein
VKLINKRVRKVKTVTILCIIVLTCVLLVMPLGCAKAELAPSNLTISPQEVAAGQTATISVDINNTGKAEGTCPVVLKIEDEQVSVQDVTVSPGASQKASFNVPMKEAGTCTVDINGLTKTFMVFRPAEFTISDLVISPTEAEISEDLTVTVNVKNIGELEDTKTVTLKFDGVEVESKNIALAGGVTETVSFTAVKDTAGTYNIEVEGLTTTLTVLQPLLSDGTQYAAHNFEIAMPADWIAFEILPEAIDAMIDQLGSTNPDLVPFLEALKNQEPVKFWAFDPASPPGFGVNLLVSQEIRLIQSLDDYANYVKTQVEAVGWTVVIGDKFNLNGCDALRLETSYTAYYPSGEPFQGEQQCVIVDHVADRYSITLSYPPEYAQQYKRLFDAVIQTFNIVQ